MSVGIGAQELCHALGRILSIGIHHDHGVAAGGLLNVRQPDGDGPLVAKIAAQAQSPYGSHNGEAIWKSLRSHLCTEPSSTRRISMLQASEEMASSSRRISSAAEGQSSRSGISTMRRNGRC